MNDRGASYNPLSANHQSSQPLSFSQRPITQPHIIIRVSGKLFEGHLSHVEQLVQSAAECNLWPQLDLSQLEEVDRAALTYLVNGENHDFGIASCPSVIRNWLDHARPDATAA